MNASVSPDRPAYRAGLIVEGIELGHADKLIVVLRDFIGDALVDQGALRADACHVISARAAAVGMATLRFTIAGLFQPVDAPGGPRAVVPSGVGAATPPTVALDVIRETFLNEPQPHVIVLDFVEHVLPQDGPQPAVGDAARIVEQLAALATDSGWKQTGHRIVLIMRTGPMNEAVTRLPGVRSIEIGLPQLDERRAALELMARSARHPLCLAPGLDLDRAARITGGISLHALSSMRYHTGPEAPLRVEDVVERKNSAIREMAGDTLIVHSEVLDIDKDIAGLPQVRRMVLEEQRRGNFSIRAALVGPPGTGKTRVSTAIAAALGVPVVSLGRILGRWVGESEGNLTRALDVIAANAPCLLIIDEADQAGLGRRAEAAAGEGSQVTANLRASLFAWLGDVGSQLGVSVVAISNRPDLLDPAAVDRFTFLPVLHPSPAETAEIMAIEARRKGIEFDPDGATMAMAAADKAFSGRQAVFLLERAQVHAHNHGRGHVVGEDVAGAVAEAMHSMGRDEELMALLAVQATSWASHLPWIAARQEGNHQAQPPAYLRAFVRPDGSVMVDALADRIRELEARRVG